MVHSNMRSVIVQVTIATRHLGGSNDIGMLHISVWCIEQIYFILSRKVCSLEYNVQLVDTIKKSLVANILLAM